MLSRYLHLSLHPSISSYFMPYSICVDLSPFPSLPFTFPYSLPFISLSLLLSSLPHILHLPTSLPCLSPSSLSPFTSLPLSLPFLPPSLRPSLLPNELVHLVMYNIVLYSDKCVLLLLAGQPHWPAASVPSRGHEYGGCRATGGARESFHNHTPSLLVLRGRVCGEVR